MDEIKKKIEEIKEEMEDENKENEPDKRKMRKKLEQMILLGGTYSNMNNGVGTSQNTNKGLH